MFPKPRLQKPPKWTVCPTVAKILSTKPHAFSVSAHLDYHLGYYACSLKNVITSFFKVMGMSLSDTYKNAQPNFLNFCQGENEKLHNARCPPSLQTGDDVRSVYHEQAVLSDSVLPLFCLLNFYTTLNLAFGSAPKG